MAGWLRNSRGTTRTSPVAKAPARHMDESRRKATLNQRTGLLSRRMVTTRVLSLRPVMVMPVASTPRPGALRRAAASTSTLA